MFFLPLSQVDHGSRGRLDGLETARLAFQRAPGGDEATNRRIGAGIALRFDLPIQELSISAPLIPSFDRYSL